MGGGVYLVEYAFPPEDEVGKIYKIAVTIDGEHIRGSPWKQYT